MDDKIKIVVIGSDKNKRKKEIQAEMIALRDELYEITNKEKKELNSTKVGKYFRQWLDVSRQFTEYVYCLSVNEFNNCIGWYFRVYDDGGIEVSPLYIVIDNYLTESEISKEDFLFVWNNIKKKLDNIQVIS